MTRKKHLSKDAWMPKAMVSDTRPAGKVRGWDWPSEKFNKRKEMGMGRRTNFAEV